MNTLYDFLPIQDMTVTTVVLVVGYLVITRKLIWHKDYDELRKEKDQWKQLALRLLGTTEKLTVLGEVTTNSVLSQAAGEEDGAANELAP